MAKKTIGYVELIWTCPRCSTKNPGPNKFCTACGAPQPENVAFEQAPDATLITDAEKIARAQAGPDIHCPYCNARNPAGSKFCGACGGDQSGAKARARGGVVGAFSPISPAAAPIICPSCGTSNPAGAASCKQCGTVLTGAKPASQPAPAAALSPAARRRQNGLLAGVALVVFAVMAGIAILATRTRDVTASVAHVEWSRTVEIEALGPVPREGWWDEIPSGAEKGSCTLKYRYTQDQPAANSREVCGTPYTVDTGTGIGEVVQECVYEVSEDWCSYTVMDWQTVESTSQGAADLEPVWPSRALAAGERYGDRKESYSVTLEAGTRTYTITPESESEFRRYAVGSEWLLKVNTFGSILSLEPAN